MVRRFKNFPGIFKKYNLFILIVIVIIAVIMARSAVKIQSIFKPKQPEGVMMEPEAMAVPVKVFKVSRTDFKDLLPVMGIAKAMRELELKFETGGVIESFNFREGEEVREGDIIASLNQRDAILKLKYSKLELDKAKKMYDVGAVDNMKLDQAKLEYESSKSDFDKTNIYASRDGYLGRQFKQEGEYVSPNDKVAIFLDMSKVYIDFGIIESDIIKVSEGQKADVYIDALPGEKFEGKIGSLFPLIEGKSKTLTARVRLDNPDNMIKPGMFARGSIHTYEKDNVLVIPVTGLQTKEEENFVYIVNPKAPEGPEVEGEEPVQTGEIEIRPVTIAYVTPEAVEISEGIKEGEMVVIEIEEDLPEGAVVEIEEVRESLTSF